MGSEIVTSMIGLVVGVLTALYFERRALKAAQAEARLLRSELDTLRASILSVGGSQHSSTRPTEPDDKDVNLVLVWLRSVQDAEGRVSRMNAYSHLIRSGYTRDSIDNILGHLVDSRSITMTSESIALP